MINRFALTGLVLLLGGAAMAQGFPDQQDGFGPLPGGFDGPGGPPPGGFGGPGGFGRPNRTITAARIPLRVLATYLSLSEAQVGKIALAREDQQEAFRPTPGQRPQQQNFDALDRKAAAAIEALLSSAQRSQLAILTKALQALQNAGVRPDAATKLQLSDEQLSRLAAGNAPEQVLSESQIKVAQSYTLPQGPPPGGFDGQQGGGRGGFGGRGGRNGGGGG